MRDGQSSETFPALSYCMCTWLLIVPLGDGGGIFLFSSVVPGSFDLGNLRNGYLYVQKCTISAMAALSEIERKDGQFPAAGFHLLSNIFIKHVHTVLNILLP